jgi:hypothetical protein
VAGLAGAFLGSSVQREVLGDVLRNLEAAARRKVRMAKFSLSARTLGGGIAYWGMTISSLFRRPSRMKRI